MIATRRPDYPLISRTLTDFRHSRAPSRRPSRASTHARTCARSVTKPRTSPPNCSLADHVFRPPSRSSSRFLPLSCLPSTRGPRRRRLSLLGVATHARVSTGFLPRPQTIIAIPRAGTEEDCHFSAISLRSPSADDGRGESSEAARIEASSRTPPRRVLMTRRTHPRTHAPPPGKSRPPLLGRVARCFSRDHLAAGLPRMATRRFASPPDNARQACPSGRRRS